MFRSKLIVSLLIIILVPCLTTVDSKCSKGCHLALGSYHSRPGLDVPSVSRVFNNSVNDIMSYNPIIANPYFVKKKIRINVPFTCDCIDGEFFGHVFPYSVQSGDTYDKIAETVYASLTTAAMLARFNSYQPPLTENAVLNVTVNCSCGNVSVSEAYGLFITYPLRVEDSLESIAAAEGVRGDLLQRFNPGANFSAGTGLVYIPGRDKSGRYPPLNPSKAGLSVGVIAGISLGAVIGALLVAFSIYFGYYKKKKVQERLLSTRYEDLSLQAGRGVSVDKSVEFSYEELARATNDFSIGHKIGQGGFGSVYYAELRGEKAAIKKMDMQATKEFLAELKMWTVWLCSPKVDVYAFGVVLYELISAKEALVKSDGSTTESKTLVTMFGEALDKADPRDNLFNLVDPRLGDNYPLDSVRKMAQLAKACTQENAQLRPSMRSVVVTLMTLSSPAED